MQPAIDHKAFVASLGPDQRARLTERSDRAGLARLALHWGVMAALAGTIGGGVPGWPLLMLPLGILIVFQFTLLHEAVHATPFRSRWLNQSVAQATGFLLLLPVEWFRQFHFAHHRWTQDPTRDPELATPKPATRAEYLLHVSGLPIWRGAVTTLLRNAAGRGRYPYVPEKAEPALATEARWMLAGYAALVALSVALGSTLLLWIWVIPALLGQPFLRLYLLAEHGRCPFVANMLENSRTTFTNRAVRLLAWNMPYHAEHHAYPAVPFHKLPELHVLARRHLAVTERGYARFNVGYFGSLER